MSTLIGILFAMVSGTCDGSFGTLMKVTKKWEWENIWLVFSITSMTVFPVILALSCVPDLLSVYDHVSMTVCGRTFLFGAGWGVGNVLFGLGLYMLGQSLAYTVMVGLIAVGGSLIPMLVTSPDKALTGGGLIIILSMIATIVGVAYCGRGGKLRDDHLQQSAAADKRHTSFAVAFLVCVGAGIFSCMFNLAFHFGKPIAEAAAAQMGGMSDSFRANTPIWLLVMLGGFIPNFVYCLYLLVRKGSWKKYLQPGIVHYWLCGIRDGGRIRRRYHLLRYRGRLPRPVGNNGGMDRDERLWNHGRQLLRRYYRRMEGGSRQRTMANGMGVAHPVRLDRTGELRQLHIALE